MRLCGKQWNAGGEKYPDLGLTCKYMVFDFLLPKIRFSFHQPNKGRTYERCSRFSTFPVDLALPYESCLRLSEDLSGEKILSGWRNLQDMTRKHGAGYKVYST